MPDTLARLARLRRLEAEQAKRDLAAAVRNERDAQRALTQAQAAIILEAHVPLAEAPGAYAAWLPAAMQAIAACRASQAQATGEREAARAELTQCLAAQKAVDTVVNDRAAQARLEAERRRERALPGPAKKGLLF